MVRASSEAEEGEVEFTDVHQSPLDSFCTNAYLRLCEEEVGTCSDGSAESDVMRLSTFRGMGVKRDA